jgi:hypothetical protein
MCCFSRAVEHVTKTNLFARSVAGGRQVLVYSMTLAAAEDLAMILPLPVPPSPPEDAVRFIDLHGYPRFFDDLGKGFRSSEVMRGFGATKGAPPPQAMLKVHDVGDFEASFVPTLADFERLDARFRIAREVWDAVPGYADFGFAVFKLRSWGARGGARTKTIHPMAFEFPRRDPSALFFPTLHIHDGAVHSMADFDHAFYCQPDSALPAYWETAREATRTFVDLTRAAGLVDGDARLRRMVYVGRHPNRDTVVTREG